jgi:hypothetical protein
MIRSAEEFIQLRASREPSEYLRAAHDEAPLEVWRDIVRRHPDMRSWVAHNKTVPVEILAVLARDPSPDVRCSVAMKNKLPSDVMLELAGDEDESVRERIAYNKNAPVPILRKLAVDKVHRVAEIAQSRLARETADPVR